MENAYAEALARMIQKGTAHAEAVRGLKRVLDASGRSALLPKIARAYARIASREEARSAVRLTVSRAKDLEHAHREVRKLLETEGVESKQVREHVDDSLIGGWRLEGNGMLVDASWKKSLLSMYNRATS